MPAPRAASQAAALEPEVLDTESRHLAAMLTLAGSSKWLAGSAAGTGDAGGAASVSRSQSCRSNLMSSTNKGDRSQLLDRLNEQRRRGVVHVRH